MQLSGRRVAQDSFRVRVQMARASLGSPPERCPIPRDKPSLPRTPSYSATPVLPVTGSSIEFVAFLKRSVLRRLWRGEQRLIWGTIVGPPCQERRHPCRRDFPRHGSGVRWGSAEKGKGRVFLGAHRVKAEPFERSENPVAHLPGIPPRPSTHRRLGYPLARLRPRRACLCFTELFRP
jgi:hypothetical protein